MPFVYRLVVSSTSAVKLNHLYNDRAVAPKIGASLMNWTKIYIYLFYLSSKTHASMEFRKSFSVNFMENANKGTRKWRKIIWIEAKISSKFNNCWNWSISFEFGWMTRIRDNKRNKWPEKLLSLGGKICAAESRPTALYKVLNVNAHFNSISFNFAWKNG